MNRFDVIVYNRSTGEITAVSSPKPGREAAEKLKAFTESLHDFPLSDSVAVVPAGSCRVGDKYKLLQP